MIDLTANRTRLGRGKESVHQVDRFALLGCDVLENVHKGCKSQVGYFAAPERFHTGDIEVFDDDDIVTVCEVVCQLEKPVPALVGDTLVGFGKGELGFAAVVAALLLEVEFTVQAANLFNRSLVEKRVFNLRAVAEGQEDFQPEVYAHDVTRCDRFGIRSVVYGEEKPDVAQLVPLDCDCFDMAVYLPALAEFVDATMYADAVAAHELPAIFSHGKRFVQFYLFEGRTSGVLSIITGLVVEETLIGGVQAKDNIFYDLAAYQLPVGVFGPVAQTGDVLAHRELVNVLTGELVVPALQGNAVVPYLAGCINSPMEMLILVAVVKPVFVGDHLSIFADCGMTNHKRKDEMGRMPVSNFAAPTVARFCIEPPHLVFASKVGCMKGIKKPLA